MIARRYHPILFASAVVSAIATVALASSGSPLALFGVLITVGLYGAATSVTLKQVADYNEWRDGAPGGRK